MYGEALYEAFPRIEMPGRRPAFGGNQAWFLRHTARVSGCGPVAAANLLAVHAQQRPAVLAKTGLQRLPDGHWEGRSFLRFMEAVYASVGTRELGPLASFMDRRHEAIRLLKESIKPDVQKEGEALAKSPLSHLPPSLGNTAARFARGTERCARQLGLPLSSNILSTFRLSRGEGLTFIKAGLLAGAPLVLLTWLERPAIVHYPEGFAKNGSQSEVKWPHFITLVGLAENDRDWGTALIASDAGMEAKLPYDSLHRAWQGPGAVKGALVLFTPRKKAARRTGTS